MRKSNDEVWNYIDVEKLLRSTINKTIATTEANVLDALETQIIFTYTECKWLYLYKIFTKIR